MPDGSRAGRRRRGIDPTDAAVELERPAADVEDAGGPRRGAFDADAVDPNRLLVDRHVGRPVAVDRELERDLVDVGEIEVSRVDPPARADPIRARPEWLAGAGSPTGDLHELDHGVLRSGPGGGPRSITEPLTPRSSPIVAVVRTARPSMSAVGGDALPVDAFDDVGDRGRLAGASDRDLGLAVRRADHDVHILTRLRRSVSSWPLYCGIGGQHRDTRP